MPNITPSEKFTLLLKAADVVTSAVQSGANSMSEDWPAKILEATYNKMVELMKKD